MKIANDVTELIGNTPLVRLNRVSLKTKCTILGKCEFMNPTSSVKDRIGFSMINSALKTGAINQSSTIIEPTSGNTGVALASVCAALDLKLILTMPESMSVERRKLLKAFGAQLILTPSETGMQGAINKAKELQATIDNSYLLQQFQNPANPEIHRETTAIEILKDTDKNIDIFITAVGTGGSLTGIAQRLKKELPEIEILAVEPKNSAVLSGKKAGIHSIQGIGAGFIPKNLDTSIYSEVIQVSDEEAIETARELAKQEGLLVGISSGANVYAAQKIALRPENKGKLIVTLLCDTGERYLSTSLFS